ncbi:MAG: ABC transporter substrate-binding protein [Chloroflexi bacterium]|nr:ABC transporter substrate-binding protein [Chloroflexota bacterium]
MTRRFTLLAFVSMAILTGAVLLAACTAPTSPTASGPPAEAAKPYGSLMVGFTFGVSAGPLHQSGNAFQGLGTAMYEGVTRMTPEGQTVPNIAERWEISPDGKTQTFNIRKGIKFHDGTDLTGADWKFSIERVIKPNSVVALGDAITWRKQIESVELKDDYTVVVNLKQPLYQLLPGIDPPVYGIYVVFSKKYVEANGEDYLTTHPMGTGPWKLVKYIPDDRLELEANEDYWNKAGIPKFKSLTIRIIREEATIVSMLKTGELDLSTVAPDSVASIKAADLRILPHDGASHYSYYMLYPADQPGQLAIGDVRVRRAMSYAINRKEMADKLMGGYAEPLAYLYARPTAYFWDSSVLKVDPYDVAQAKKLLAEAGYPNGFSTTIWDAGAGGLDSVLNAALSGYWRQVGVNAELLAGQYSTLSRMITPKLSKEAWNKIYATVGSGGMWQFEKVAATARSGAHGLVSSVNPQRDELIDKVALTKDPAEKKRLALQATLMSKEEYDQVGVLGVKTIFAIGARVGEFKPITGGANVWGPVYATITHAK